MSEKSEDKSLSDDIVLQMETDVKLKSKYMTRKKQIDFAKIGEKLGLTGSSCHYCKNTMTVQYSNACRNTQKTQSKKKTCNKKFCYDCLQKFFVNYWENRSDKLWKCPCCLNQCTCNQCKKNWIKSNNFKKNMVKETKSNEGNSVTKKEPSPKEKGTKNHSSHSNSNDSNNNYTPLDPPNNILVNDQVEPNPTNIYLSRSSNYCENKFSLFNNKPKIEIISEKEFLTYKRSLDEYFNVLDKYNNYFDKLNIQRIKKNK